MKQTKIELTNEISKLIMYLANMQIQSFNNILMGRYIPEKDDLELLKQVGADWTTIHAECKVKIEHYKDMFKCPLLLGATSDFDLSVMRHLLFNIEDELMNADKFDLETINQLWDIFFQIEEERNPKLAIYNKSKNYGN